MKNSLKAVLARGAIMAFLAPRLAQDAKVDLSPALEGVDAKNFDEKKAAIAEGVKAAVDGKLAKDASLEDLSSLIDAVGQHGKQEDGADAYDDAPPPAATAKPSHEALCEFLKGKLSPEDYAAAEKMLGAGAQDAGAGGPPPFAGQPKVGGAMDESPEAKAAREKAEAEKVAADKVAQDAAIKTATDEAVAAEKARAKGVREAEKAIRPYVGEIALDAALTASDVYRAAFKVLEVDVKDVHESAFPALLKAQKPAAKTVAQDAQVDEVKPYHERFPEVARLDS